MDTYASSAGDPDGFYDIPALANAVDAFFVMEYSPNVAATAQASSPLTSSLFSDLVTVAAVCGGSTGRQGHFGNPAVRRGLADHREHSERDGDRPGHSTDRQRHRGDRRPHLLGLGHRQCLDGLPGRQPMA